MSTHPNTPGPNLDPDFLLAQLEAVAWSTRKTIAMADRLTEEELTAPVVSSCPSILATLQHLYQWDKYYFLQFLGERVHHQKVDVPKSFDELKVEWRLLQADMLAWARQHIADRKNDVLGGWGVWPVWMLISQIASHGAFHRGQVVTLLRQAGCPPQRDDFTDIIFHHLWRYPQQNQKAWMADRLRAIGQSESEG